MRGEKWRQQAAERGMEHLGYVECRSRERAQDVCCSIRPFLDSRRGAARVNGSDVFVGPVGKGRAPWWDESGVIVRKARGCWWSAKDPGGRRSRPRAGMFYILRRPRDSASEETWLEKLLDDGGEWSPEPQDALEG